jgi:hypothetical protein
VLASVDAREVIPLNENWRTKVTMKHHDWNTPINDPTGIMDREFSDGAWEVVDVPHNWEGYTAYIHPHANLHGVAWYRKGFVVDERHAGGHKGAFSGFSLDITPFSILARRTPSRCGPITPRVSKTFPGSAADAPGRRVPRDRFLSVCSDRCGLLLPDRCALNPMK